MKPHQFKNVLYFVAVGLCVYACKQPSLYKIPGGYHIRDSVVADLNGDKIQDKVLVLQNDSDEQYKPHPRPVVILTGTSRGYTFATQCDSLVLQTNMGGAKTSDPYSGIKVDSNGRFTVGHYGGMASFEWEHYFTFCYDKQKKDWFLSKVENTAYGFNPASDTLEVSSSFDTVFTTKDFGSIFFSQFSYDRFPVE